MGQILGLITGKLETVAGARDQDALLRKCKAITALFPYAVWKRRDKTYPILDLVLHVANTTQPSRFWWRHIEPFMKILFGGTTHVCSNRTLMLLSPYMPWDRWDFREDRARGWAAAASTVPRVEGVAPSVVDTLLQVASSGLLPPDLRSDTWSWLTLRPSLPPVCKGREVGSHPRVVQMVRNLKDIEILKSYLLLIWSEWDSPRYDGYDSMLTSILEEFSGIGMNSHRTDLLQRLDHVLEQLDKGLDHFRQHGLDLTDFHLVSRKSRYGGLKRKLLEVDRALSEDPTSAPSRLTTLFELPTHAATHRTTPSKSFERCDG